MNTTWSGCLHMAVAGAGEASETAGGGLVQRRNLHDLGRWVAWFHLGQAGSSQARVEAGSARGRSPCWEERHACWGRYWSPQ